MYVYEPLSQDDVYAPLQEAVYVVFHDTHL